MAVWDPARAAAEADAAVEGGAALRPGAFVRVDSVTDTHPAGAMTSHAFRNVALPGPTQGQRFTWTFSCRSTADPLHLRSRLVSKHRRDCVGFLDTQGGCDRLHDGVGAGSRREVAQLLLHVTGRETGKPREAGRRHPLDLRRCRRAEPGVPGVAQASGERCRLERLDVWAESGSGTDGIHRRAVAVERVEVDDQRRSGQVRNLVHRRERTARQ